MEDLGKCKSSITQSPISHVSLQYHLLDPMHLYNVSGYQDLEPKINWASVFKEIDMLLQYVPCNLCP